MSFYADTNFLGRIYLERSESKRAEALLREHRPVLPVTWLLRLETTNAFEQAVFSGFGEDQRRIVPEFAAACHSWFRDDLREGTALRLSDISLSDVTQLFEEIALRHTARHGFRTYDILHVASALTLGCHTFWSFDKRASKLAKLEGLRTI